MSGRGHPVNPSRGPARYAPHSGPWVEAPTNQQRLATIAALAHDLNGAGAARRPDSLSLALAVLEATLNAIDAPVFVLDPAARIVHGNTCGRALLDEQPILVPRSLERCVRGQPAELPWKLSAIDGGPEAPWHLAVLVAPVRAPGDSKAVADAAARWRLTKRQRQVLDLLALGLTNADIALGLEIGECTVEFHLSAIFDKVGVDNRATLLARLLDF